MQRTYYMAAIAAFALFFACCKKDGNEYWGNISALKNGSPWETIYCSKIRDQDGVPRNSKSRKVAISTFNVVEYGIGITKRQVAALA